MLSCRATRRDSGTQHLVRTPPRKLQLVTDHAVVAFALVALFAGAIVGDGVRVARPVAAGTQTGVVAMRQRVGKLLDVAARDVLGWRVRHRSSLQPGYVV